MTDFLLFLGRFHVLALHLPIGMVLLTAFVHWFARTASDNTLNHALPVLWACTALSAILTVVLGMLHAGEGGFTAQTVNAHRYWAIGFTVGTVVAWFLSLYMARLYRRVGGWLSILLLVAVTMTGHYGGNLTHGATYLVEYAPQPLRSLAGLGERREAVTDLASADPWLDVIKPMLDARCGNCHNADKQRGQLDMSSLDNLLVGGENGSVVLAGNAGGSDLYRRISLPQDHDDFMPAEGKTPLTEAQVQIIGWWIDAGLPENTTLASLETTAEISNLLAVELGLAPAVVTASMPALPVLSAAQLAALQAQRFLVRPQAEQGGGVIVMNEAPGLILTEQRLAVLADAAPAIVELDLAGSQVYDAHLDSLAGFTNLQHLNLSNNQLTDNRLDLLAALPALAVLNLYGNPGITDAGLESLATSASLRKLYLWQTGVTAEGMAALKARLPEVDIIP